jgi:Tol biopolymer transport system component
MNRIARADVFARPRSIAIALAFALLVFGGLVALRAFSGEAARVPSPGERIEALELNATAPLVVYSEFGFEADTIWVANADNPGDRTSIAQVPHAYGYGVIPALSPDGNWIAVVALPNTERSPRGNNAQLLTVDVASGTSTVKASDIDLSEPVWSPLADTVAVRRLTSTAGAFGKTEIVTIGIDGSVSTLMRADAQLFPVDFSPDGRTLYATRLSAGGTDLAAANPNGDVRQIAHLSDEAARDWELSPDGTRLAYVAAGPSALLTAWTANVNGGESRVALPGRGEAQLSPQWEASGGLTVAVLGGDGSPVRLAGDGRALGASVLAPTSGFDIPLTWSPGGRDLAVRGFSNASLADPGASWVFIVGTDGSRRKLSENSDVVVAGWLPAEVRP